MNKKSIGQKNRWSYIWLAIGAILYVLGTGKWSIAFASWLWPVFLLRFTRMKSSRWGLLLAAVVFVAGFAISWQGTMKLVPYFVFVTAAIIAGLLYMLVFLVDRFITPRIKGFWSTLVFPLAFVLVEYLYSFGSNANLGSLAYTQYGNLPLMQIVSVTGIWGLVFLIAWFASVVNHAWEQEFTWSRIRSVVGIYAFVFSLVLLFGGARLAFFAPESETVPVASITTPEIQSHLAELRKTQEPPSFEKTVDTMRSLSLKASRAGAKIVLWQEYGALLAKENEKELNFLGS